MTLTDQFKRPIINQIWNLFCMIIFLYGCNNATGQKEVLTETSDDTRMVTHPRSINNKVFEVWRSPGRFTKNPDIIELPSGRLMLVYSDNDDHWSQENQILTLLASDDEGETWFKHKEIGSRDIRKGEERYVTPRLSRLKDGRLVVLIDQNDYTHFHEDQPPGILAFWSEDDGETWTGEQETGIMGFEPDRMMDLPDGRLAVLSHVMIGETRAYAEIMHCSDDGGKTWYNNATIAHDGHHFFCEGALVILNDGKELACVMRENHSGGISSFVSFSQDNGNTWSSPQRLPFAIHRPYLKELEPGKVLVTGRHVNGGLGTYGWYGNLKEAAGNYQIGGPRQKYEAELTAEALLIKNGEELEARYSLLPPESSASEILYEAEVKVEGPADTPVAFMSVSKLITKAGPAVLYIAPNWIGFSTDRVDHRKAVDMTQYRKIAFNYRRGLMQVLIDDEVVIKLPVDWEVYRIADARGGDATKRTQFGQYGEKGQSYWKSVSYTLDNPNFDDYQYTWESSSGEWPDQYQRDQMIQIHANPPGQREGHKPDHGYSSWVVLDENRIMFVDYTNFGDPQGKSHLVGAFMSPEDVEATAFTKGRELPSQ